MDRIMSPEQLARAPGTVNRSAVQTFAKLVKVAGLASLHATRTSAEDAVTDFVALCNRLQFDENAATVSKDIAYWT
jgi:hypothetical protein